MALCSAAVGLKGELSTTVDCQQTGTLHSASAVLHWGVNNRMKTRINEGINRDGTK